MPFLTPVLGEGSPTKIDYGKKGTLVLTSLLEDLTSKRAGITKKRARGKEAREICPKHVSFGTSTFVLILVRLLF